MANNPRHSKIFYRVLAKIIDLIVVYSIWKIFPESGLFLGILYILLSDGIFKGKSIGKFFLNLRVVKLEQNTPANFRDSIIRNLFFAFALLLFKIPLIGWALGIIIFIFEFIMIVGDSESKRLGDYLANTSVIEE
ncbi:MAG: RDD family protein [Thermodesulfovibrio sp.]|uniref:RDD family protein n=1 Tax=unclassified Thermodesulfovibrio TaxID=2645936 RepID=UPI00083B4C09|nr:MULTISPECIES: RDD family protein [unclassified Thermodesulfovibrio]MDI1472685.1 RDD family protein [Thermodesulfovibrio sp. 1176]MDI6714779.1 RDD family protein [Thermodesulfovibrio sp.]ODA44452.1 hypothetical protein THER_0845 [Thermodesulfovibrio sp. N1]